MIGKLTNDELLSETKRLVLEERKLTLKILHHFREIEKRRLFALRGFSSLFEMAVHEFGYSEAAASRRIAAARLLAEVPELHKKVEEGALSVTTLSTLQYFFNDQRRQAKPLSAEAKREVIEQIEHKSKRETEKVLAAISGEPIRRDFVREVSSTHSEVRFTAEEKLMNNLARIRALKGHKDLTDYNSLFLYLSELALERIDPDRRIERKEARSAAKAAVVVKVLAGARARNPAGGVAAQQDIEREGGSTLIPANGVGTRPTSNPVTSKPVASKRAIEDLVWKRDGGVCTYIDPFTKRRCDSRHTLEYDHIHPKALDGPYTPENLRLRCRAHNQLHAIQTYGAQKMQFYLLS